MVPQALIHSPLNLNLSVLFKHNILLPAPLFKAIRRPKRVFHELHICHLAIPVDLAPDRERADGHLPQGPRTVGEAAKDRYIFADAEEGLDLEGFFGPDPINGGEGINDGLRAGWEGRQYSGSSQAR